MVLQVYLEGARTAAQLGLSGSDAALSSVNSSAIGIAAQHGFSNVVEYLLNEGADCNKSVQDGTTLLMVASLGNHIEVVQLLLHPSADKHAEKGEL